MKWYLHHLNLPNFGNLPASGEYLDGAYINFTLGNLEGRGDPAAAVALNP
jgi:hypothetical protein